MSSSCVLLHHVYCTVDYILISSQKSALFITRFSIKSYHVSRNAIVKHLCQLKESIMKTSRNVNALGIKIGIVWLPLPWYNMSNVLKFAYSEIVLELSRWEVNALDINSGRVMFTWCNINTVIQRVNKNRMKTCQIYAIAINVIIVWHLSVLLAFSCNRNNDRYY